MTKSLTNSDFNKNCNWFLCKECNKYQRWTYNRTGELIVCKACNTEYKLDTEIVSRIELAGKRLSFEDQFNYFSYLVGKEYFDTRTVCKILNVSLSYGYKIVNRWISQNKIIKIARKDLTKGTYNDSHGYLYKIRRDDNE